jgi:hypothetical protein
LQTHKVQGEPLSGIKKNIRTESKKGKTQATVRNPKNTGNINDKWSEKYYFIFPAE